jgi:uncharacterized protein YciI
MMVMFEVENRAAAEAFVATSPFREAGLYDHFHLYDFADQIG